MKKQLSELNPDLHSKRLFFTCPSCPKTHSIRVPFDEKGEGNDKYGGPIWKRVGELSVDTLTIHPSIDCDTGRECRFHGHITHGVVSW